MAFIVNCLIYINNGKLEYLYLTFIYEFTIQIRQTENKAFLNVHILGTLNFPRFSTHDRRPNIRIALRIKWSSDRKRAASHRVYSIIISSRLISAAQWRNDAAECRAGAGLHGAQAKHRKHITYSHSYTLSKATVVILKTEFSEKGDIFLVFSVTYEKYVIRIFLICLHFPIWWPTVKLY